MLPWYFQNDNTNRYTSFHFRYNFQLFLNFPDKIVCLKKDYKLKSECMRHRQYARFEILLEESAYLIKYVSRVIFKGNHRR